MNSSKYFEKRSEMRMKKAHDKATVSMARVNKAYDNSLYRLKKEIKSLTKDFDGMKPEEIREFLNGHISYDRYNEWLQIYNTTKDKAIKKKMEKFIKANATGFRIRRKEAILRDIEMERLAMTGSQLDNFGSHLRNVYKSTLNETGFKGVNKNLIDEAMKHNWAGSNYSKRVWHNNRVLAKRIQTNLFESFISGKSNKQIVDELEYLTDLGRHAANRLVRTETSYMVNSADLESSKQRGIKAKKFEATLDSRTSKVCRRHNQKIIPIDNIKIGENAPPMHPYCRSFLADVLQGWDYETDEELDRLLIESDAKSVAQTEMRKVQNYEPYITQDLKMIAKKHESKLAGLEYRMKSEDSLVRKIISDAQEKEVTIEVAAKEINDKLRYTFVNDYDIFTDSYFSLIDELEKRGYNIIRVKNTFADGNTYKGINTLVKRNNDVIFELQYHTPKSYEVKEGILHKLYEKQRTLDKEKDFELWDQLEKEMIKASSEIISPKGVERIK